MSLATSMRLSSPLPTLDNDEEKSSNMISTTSITNTNLTKLYKHSDETETKSYIDQNVMIRQSRRSIEHALLAQRKIFLRKKLGEGSFSSVREGFDLFHQYKVAVKVIWDIFIHHSYSILFYSINSIDSRSTTSFERFSRKISTTWIRHLATYYSQKYY